MNALTMLSLSGNNISSIDKEFMNNVTNLRYLYLSENNIKNINSTILKQVKFSVIQPSIIILFLVQQSRNFRYGLQQRS